MNVKLPYFSSRNWDECPKYEAVKEGFACSLRGAVEMATAELVERNRHFVWGDIQGALRHEHRASALIDLAEMHARGRVMGPSEIGLHGDRASIDNRLLWLRFMIHDNERAGTVQ